jgi:hypothetical protein
MYRIDYAQVTSTMDDFYPRPVIEEPFFGNVSCVPLQEVHDRVRVHLSDTYPIQLLTKTYWEGGRAAVDLTSPGVKLQRKLDCLVMTFYRMLAVIGQAYANGMESANIDQITTQHQNEGAVTYYNESTNSVIVQDPFQAEMEDALNHYSNPVHKPPTEAIVLWANDLGVHEYPVVLPPMVNHWNSPAQWWNRERRPIESYTRATQLPYGAQSRTLQFIDLVNVTIAGWMSGQRKHVARRAIFEYFGERLRLFGFEGDLFLLSTLSQVTQLEDAPHLGRIVRSHLL